MSIGENVGEVDMDNLSADGGLTAEEQAQFEQMSKGEMPAERTSEPAEPVDEEIAGEGDIEHGDEGDVEQVADATSDAKPEKRNPKTVSFGRFERELRKANERAEKAAKEAETERSQRVRLDERTRLLMEAINTRQAPAAKEADAAPKEPDDPEPDSAEDPFAHAAWTRRELGRTQDLIRKMGEGQEARQRETQQRNEESQIMTAFTSDLERTAAEKPEYGQAFVHMRDSRYTELGWIFAGIDINDKEQCAKLTPEQQSDLSNKIQQTFHADQMEVARTALKSGQSPAQYVFNLARARGFAPPAANAAQTASAAQRAAPAVAQANPKVPAGGVKDQLEAIRQGQAAATSLSDAGGSPGGAMTPERLANMSDDEFSEYYDSMSPAQQKRMMGQPRN